MIDIIFIHIHKAGGHSIYKTLKSVYGNELDIPRNRKEYFLKYPPINSFIGIVPDHIRVMYGHFEYLRVKDVHEKYHSKVITWLRDPVDRVISHYYFNMMKVELKTDPNPDKKFTLETSLLEFAKDSQNMNMMSKFLAGIDHRELFFIGTLENIDEDLQILSRMLNWRKFKTGFHENSNRSYKLRPNCKTTVVTSEMRKIIETLNSEDVELYSQAIKLRNKYRKESNHNFLVKYFGNGFKSFIRQ